MSTADSTAQQTIRALYSEHHRWLVGWLRHRIGCVHHAHDLAQDTFVRVLTKRYALSSVREPRAWLTTIANGLAVDHMRRQRLERAYMDAIGELPGAELPSEETRLLLLETLTRIDAMLDGLNPKVRTAFLLSRLEGWSYAEIAQHLDVCLSSVEKYMATALRHCLAMRAAG